MNMRPKEVWTYPPSAAAIPDTDISAILECLLEKVERNVQDKVAKYAFLERGLKPVEKIIPDQVKPLDSDHDQSGLAAIDERLAILELSIISLERRIHAHVSGQRQKRNQDVPVNCFPPEILIQIFSVAVDDDGGFGGQVDSLDNLALVCHQWNDLVKGSPSLWTVICSNKPDQLERILTYSAHSSLDIRCYGPLNERWRESVEKHGARWRSFSLRNGYLDTLRWFVETSTPSLRELRIDMDPSASWVDHHDIRMRDEVIEGLNHLSLCRTSMSWNPSFLFGLKTLHLQALGITNRISTSQLVAVLRASHGLTDLRLGHSAINESKEHEDTTPVELPLLTGLSLSTHPQAAHDILTVLCIPRCSNLKIELTSTTDIEILDARMTHISAAVRSILTRLDLVEVVLRPGLMKLLQNEATPVGDVTLDIHLLHNTPELVRWLDTVFISLQDQPSICLTVEDTFLLDQGWPLFLLTAHVYQVVMRNVQAHMKEWLQYISHPILFDNTLQWPLPHLRSMDFHDCRPLDSQDLLQMMQNRYGLHGGAEENVSAQGALDLAVSAGYEQEWSEEDPSVEVAMESMRSVPSVASLELLAIYGELQYRREDIEKLEVIIGGGKFKCPMVDNERNSRVDEDIEDIHMDNEDNSDNRDDGHGGSQIEDEGDSENENDTDDDDV
ncbi:hypothetical protein FRB98_001943 [Tulasnella sp. 332]|nr:hypothetical protein FRB98_001943 [Tulasnella sp. 332]